MIFKRAFASILASAFVCNIAAFRLTSFNDTQFVSAADYISIEKNEENLIKTASNTKYDAETVYNAMISLQDKYPTGMEWTNDNYYKWNGGIYSGGYGCVGFAFMLSDAAFGSLPTRITESFNADSLRVGDILRYSGHSVVVLEIHETYVTIAEGNINNSILWGREISFDEIESSFEHHMTRYPNESVTTLPVTTTTTTTTSTTPITTTTVTTTPEITVNIGDIDDNKSIDAVDASMILAEYAITATNGKSTFTLSQKKAADVNNDGAVNASDASLVLGYYAYTSTGGVLLLKDYISTIMQ